MLNISSFFFFMLNTFPFCSSSTYHPHLNNTYLRNLHIHLTSYHYFTISPHVCNIYISLLYLTETITFLFKFQPHTTLTISNAPIQFTFSHSLKMIFSLRTTFIASLIYLPWPSYHTWFYSYHLSFLLISWWFICNNTFLHTQITDHFPD